MNNAVAHTRGDARVEGAAIKRHDSGNPAHDARIIGAVGCDRQLARVARMMVA
jgi:hypothetical protein